jgi:hypothetical protein
LTLSLFGSGCFTPSGDDGPDAEADTDAPAATDSGGVAGDGVPGSTGAAGVGTDTTPAGDTTGAVGDGDTGEMTTDTGEPIATDTGEGTETGEPCDAPLGTEDDCLACGDSCQASDQCTPDGCLSPQSIGFDQPFTGIGGYPGRLWGYAVEVTSDGWLTQLDFHAVGNGGGIQLALYSDDGGVPDQLLAATEVIGSYGPGTHEHDVTPTPLAAGTYWVMARNTAPSQIGLNFIPNVVPPFPMTSIFIDFDAPLPAALVGTDTFPSYEVNLWITVLD